MSDAGGVFSGVHRVLLIQLSAIGDVLRAGSVADALKRRYPSIRVGMLVFSDYAEVLSGIPNLSYRHVFPNSTLKRALNSAASDEDGLRAIYAHAYLPLEEMQLRNYDLAVNFHFSTTSAYLSALSGAKKILGMSPGLDGEINISGEESFALYEDLRSRERLIRSREHLAVRYRRMCGLPETEVRLDFELPIGAPSPLPAGQFVAIHVGAGWRDKCWPAEKWRSLISQIHGARGWTPVLFGTTVERDRNFAGVVDGLDVPVVDLCGKPLLESARALSDCMIFIGADSGPMHLASALDVPVVALFGPTSAAESYPLCGRNAVIWRPKLSDIGVDEVLDAVSVVTSPSATRLSAWPGAAPGCGAVVYENPIRSNLARKNVA